MIKNGFAGSKEESFTPQIPINGIFKKLQAIISKNCDK